VECSNINRGVNYICIICLKDPGKIGLESVDWIYLAWDRDWWQADVNMIMSLLVPLNVVNILTVDHTVSFSSRAAPWS
jgi:hypothetical protein